jgi:hypothetical protein
VEHQGIWEVSQVFSGVKVNCIVQDPHSPKRIYIGTQTQGILSSTDLGGTWEKVGLGEVPVKALAFDPQATQAIYAGGKPVTLYVTHNGGKSWQELPALRMMRKWWWFSPADPPGMLPYVNSLAVSPTDPDVLLAGIEAGAVMRSEDLGESWSGHLPGSDRDCHSLKFHLTDGQWVYEGGGMSGVAFSRNGGKNWSKPKEGLGTKYGWMVAADPENPEIWYLSASVQGNLLKGEFTPPAHQEGRARAHIYRKIGDTPWQMLSGGLPDPMDYLAYGLVTVSGAPGHLFAGLGNGDVWHTADYGESWTRLPFNMGGVHQAMLVI